jgi:hypothetical protein
MDIRATLTDENLFAKQFDGDSWDHWKSLIFAFYGLKLTKAERKLVNALTQRTATSPAFNELWLVVGRRGGKSNISALLAVYEAFFVDHRDKLAAGEVATVFVIAQNMKQARSVMRYIKGLIETTPMLEAMVVKSTSDSIELSNRCVIEIMAASFKSIRGYTVSCAILDECAFWNEGGANPDKEIINAIRPSLATLDGKLIALSSPYARKGILWDAYKRYFGKESSRQALVAQAPTLLMNNTLPKRVVEQAYKEDEASASAEYGAQFRVDVETFINRDVVEALVAPKRIELPFVPDNKYYAFTDPSGGAKDSFTLSISHKERDTIILDVVRAIKPPFSPERVINDYCELLKDYNITNVVGDRYAGEFPRELFYKRGINYDLSKKNKSELYRDLLPVLNSGFVELLDNTQLINELVGLERKTARGGRDIIDHAPNSHDDLINAAAGAIDLCHKPISRFVFAC